MSLSKIIEISCPKCKKKQEFKLWQAVNVTEDILLKDEVFSRDIFKFVCKECKVESIIEYPFIYHDADKKFFVYFDSSGKFENVIETSGYKTRVATDYFEFLEIIRILEDGIEEELIKSKKDELFDKFRNNESLKNMLDCSMLSNCMMEKLKLQMEF